MSKINVRWPIVSRFVASVSASLVFAAMPLMAAALSPASTAQLDGGTEPDHRITEERLPSAVQAGPMLFFHQYPDPIFVMYGGDAEIIAVLENRGDVALNNVSITANSAPECTRNNISLAVGAKLTYTCFARDVTKSFDNIMSAKANGFTGVGDSDTSTISVVYPVSGPAISISQDPARTMVVKGKDAKFYMAVLNIGNTTMTNVTVTSNVSGLYCTELLNNTPVPVPPTFSSLAPGKVEYFWCYAPAPTVSFTSNVTVTATRQGSSTTYTDTDSDPIVMADYYIAPHYTVNVEQANPGNLITYTLTVENIEPAAPEPAVTAPDVTVYATLPQGTTFVAVISGTYTTNLPNWQNAPSGAGAYWQGDLPRRVPHVMKLVVRAKNHGGAVIGLGRATINTGELFLDDRLTTYVQSPHPTFLPMVRR